MAIFMQSQKMTQDKTMQITALITLKFLLLSFCSNGQTTEQLWLPDNDSLIHIQIETDSLFDSPQRINLLIVPGAYPHKYSIEFGYQKSELLRTSQIAQNWNALAAINGGFFDMDGGGSVSYFEIDDSVINRSKSPGIKWAVPDSLTNGAIILYKNHILEIDSANLHQCYEDSKLEAFVMVSGPLLIKDAILQDLPDMKFTNNRHPRTCLGINEESIIFVTIDGRSETAAGMNLFEVQNFLLDLGCQDAINLDGGGSTSMWIKDKGLVNMPSDKTGERSVANALIILEK